MKLTTCIFFIAIIFFANSCKNNHNKIPSNIINDTTILDTSKLSSDTNNLQVNKIDTIKYSNLRYWDTTMDRFHSAYIDTFSVDGNKFRFINPFANKPQLDILVYLEKLVNNKWIYTGFTVGTMNHVYEYNHSRDINGDGFIDITQNLKWNQAVYFYDPKTKTYPGTAEPMGIDSNFINYDWQLIDTTKKIFCDFFDGKQMCDNIHSTLYTFNGFVKKDLYDLELYNCTETNNDTHLVTKLILSKIVERKYYDETEMDSKDSLIDSKDIPLQTAIDLDKEYDPKVGYFDYVTFWKTHYKELLGYR